jgi:8-oxo-dGTP pyrophosphatase MutT (NUDIX family)
MKFIEFINALTKALAKHEPSLEVLLKMSPSNRANNPVVPNNKTRKSAILILFYPANNQIYLPLILRPKYDGVHAGQMAFPGGRYELKDENLTRTALREAQEEIGIKASDVNVIGSLTELFIPPSNFFVLPVIGYLNYKPDFYPSSYEVDKVFEVNLSEIIDKNIIGEMELEVRSEKIKAPFYDIQDCKVWGATAVMISELLAVIENFRTNLENT